jgi:hypothetical protein
MSIVGYFGPGPLDLRVEAGDLSKGVKAGITAGVAEVSGGGLPVEEAKALPSFAEKRYGSVGDYDPVLRAHCRLDREG